MTTRQNIIVPTNVLGQVVRAGVKASDVLDAIAYPVQTITNPDGSVTHVAPGVIVRGRPDNFGKSFKISSVKAGRTR